MSGLIGSWVARYRGASSAPATTAHLVETERAHQGVAGVVTRCGREMALETFDGELGEASSDVLRCLTCQGIRRGTASTLPLEPAEGQS